MKKLMVIAVSALAVTVFAGPNGGQGRAARRGPGGNGDIQRDPVVQMVTNHRVAKKIGLTEEQTKQIKEIEKANHDNRAELRKQLDSAMEKQAELLKAEKIDEAAVMGEIDKAFEARKAMAKQQAKRIISIKTILTSEQIAKALEEAKNVAARRGKRGKDAKAEGGDKPPCPPEGCPEGCSEGGDKPPCPPEGCPEGGCPEGGCPEGGDKPPCPPQD